MKNINTAQQGDVLIKKIDKLPEGEIKIRNPRQGKLILAEGESTGHYHGILAKDSTLMEIDNVLYLELKNQSTLEHQEHGPITLDPGLYNIGGVREHDYLSGMVRKVVD